jgi:hypothetical protein
LIPNPILNGEVLYLHERIESDGTPRLVCVRFKSGWLDRSIWLGIFESSVKPASSLSGWGYGPQWAVQMSDQILSSHRMRFFAGQNNPTDLSKFTIDFEIDGIRRTIQGQLRNNGDVELTCEGFEFSHDSELLPTDDN